MRQRNKAERGQAIVLIALATVGLLAFTALAIDGGNAVNHRREMQNAADAGSLSGTRTFREEYVIDCVCGDDTSDETPILIAANIWAEKNGVEDTNGTPSDEVNDNVVAYYIDENGDRVSETPVGGHGGVPCGLDPIGVEVETVTEFSGFFSSLIGHDTLGAGAGAAARVYTAETFTNFNDMLPLGVPNRDYSAEDSVIAPWGPSYCNGPYEYMEDGVTPNDLPCDWKGVLDLDTGSDGTGEPGSYVSGLTSDPGYCSNKPQCVGDWIDTGWPGSIDEGNYMGLYGGDLGNNAADAILARIAAQGTSDAGGNYGVFIIPLWEEPFTDPVHITGFMPIKLYEDGVNSSSIDFEFTSMFIGEATPSTADITCEGFQTVQYVR